MYKNKSVAAVILARMGSTRLKDKMLLPFADTSVVQAAINRILACEHIDHCVFATTTRSEDDKLAALIQQSGLHVVRGSENDVVQRMINAIDSLPIRPDVIVRGCCDNPLCMPTVIDEGIRELVDTGADMLTPFESGCYPFGFGAAVMTRNCLERIAKEASLVAHREHVENFCLDHSESFHVHHQQAPPSLHFPELALTLDHEIDYRRLQFIARQLTSHPLAEQPEHLIYWIRQANVAILAPKGTLSTRTQNSLARRCRQLLYWPVNDDNVTSKADEAISCGADLVVSTLPLVLETLPGRGCVMPDPSNLDRFTYLPGDGSAAYPISNAKLDLQALLNRCFERILGGFPPQEDQHNRFWPPQDKLTTTRPGFNSAIDVLRPKQVRVAPGLESDLCSQLEEEATREGFTLLKGGQSDLSDLESVFCELHTSADGYLQPENDIIAPLGHLSQTTVIDAWQSPLMQRLRISILNTAHTAKG